MGNSDISKAFGDLERQLWDEMHETVALELVNVARENRMTTVDDIDLELEGNDGTIDEARVRRRANQILAGG